jgi:hypothetical protein
MVRWQPFGAAARNSGAKTDEQGSGSDDTEAQERRPARWSLGILNDKQTDEVPGLSNAFSLTDPI